MSVCHKPCRYPQGTIGDHSPSRASIRFLVACVCLGVAAFILPPAASAEAEASCTKVAGPTGDDSASGTAGNPFGTVQRLVNSLVPGQTGCLRAGIYEQEELTLATPGVRLTSFPGERAQIAGRIRVSGTGVSVDHLTLNGHNSRDLPSPTINADDVAFRGNDVSSPRSLSCFLLGGTTEVRRPVIEGNRIHDCGEPATLLGAGIYMSNVDDAEIVENTIYDNAQRGIKIGPDSQGALIRGNVIDGNPLGLNFSGVDESASSNNLVEHNVIANSTRWWNVQTYWPGRAGSGNLVRRNCLHGGNPDSDYNQDGGVSGDDEGFTVEENLIAEPDYIDRDAKDFRLREESPCREVYPAGDGLGVSESGGDGRSGGEGLVARILDEISSPAPGWILLISAFLLIALGRWQWRSWAGRGR
jgi:parallel beta helix pectate lyase-like protein